MVQFKTSVWPPETQLWTVRCLLWNIQLFLYLHILELGHWCGCLVAVSESVTWPKTRSVTREHVIKATRLDVPPACLVFARHPGNLRWPTGDKQYGITGKQLTNCSVSENSLDDDRASYSIITALFPQCRKQNGGRSGSRTFTVAT